MISAAGKLAAGTPQNIARARGVARVPGVAGRTATTAAAIPRSTITDQLTHTTAAEDAAIATRISRGTGQHATATAGIQARILAECVVHTRADDHTTGGITARSTGHGFKFIATTARIQTIIHADRTFLIAATQELPALAAGGARRGVEVVAAAAGIRSLRASEPSRPSDVALPETTATARGALHKIQ
jgi:hypothetical protein